MPEGDTLYRIAVRLRPLVVGRRIARAAGDAVVRPDTLAGRTVTDVVARGKHLLIALDDGTTLHSHLGMTGSWHRYATGEPWQKPVRFATLTLEFEGFVIVCFSAEVMERLETRRQELAPTLAGLGPDILSPDFETAPVVKALYDRATTPLGVLLLDQRVLAGVGNVYKSEALFLCGLDPFSTPPDHPAIVLTGLVDRTRALMRKNLQGTPRRTRFAAHGPRVWVYGRPGEPCLRCGTRVAMRRQGDLGRSTYWCASCQPPQGR